MLKISVIAQRYKVQPNDPCTRIRASNPTAKIIILPQLLTAIGRCRCLGLKTQTAIRDALAKSVKAIMSAAAATVAARQ